MANKKTSRRALILSAVSLILCLAMLTGTTFAWFTDNVTTGSNIIKSGNLDVELEYKSDYNADYKPAADATIFDYELWEPGYTEIRYIKISNVGNLAFRYCVNIIPTLYDESTDTNLADVIDVYLIPADEITGAVTRETLAGRQPVGTLSDLMADADGAARGILLPESSSAVVTISTEDAAIAETGSAEYCIALKMQESAGNEYKMLTVNGGFTVQLLATQYTWENDSFDNTYDKDSAYKALPVASVKTAPEYVNTELPWGSYGQWSPTQGLEANLEAAYIFECEDSPEEAAESPYADWYCDFYVMLDQPLGANEIFLGGNYGDWGWIGFHNGDLTLEANTEIPLLGSVTTNPWTYANVAGFVNTFTCGVGDVDGALEGATFTVMLRLTNPEDANEFYNVSTISYTFGAAAEDTGVTTADELQTAVNAGGTVKLGADINMNKVRVTIPEDANVTLDLNGHTLTSKDGGGSNTMAVYVSRGANLTLKDSVGGGKIVASCYGIYVQPGATFTMNGGEINVSGNSVYDIGVTVWNGKFVMNSGAINAKYAVWNSDYWMNADDASAVPCEVTIASGCVINSTSGIDIDSSDAPDATVKAPASVVVNRVKE